MLRSVAEHHPDERPWGRTWGPALGARTSRVASTTVLASVVVLSADVAAGFWFSLASALAENEQPHTRTTPLLALASAIVTLVGLMLFRRRPWARAAAVGAGTALVAIGAVVWQW
jgi:hypothetical protein